MHRGSVVAWSARSRRRGELPAGWGALRARVLERDGGRCVVCGGPANQVDHVDPSGPHELWNLRALCRTCHMRRTQAQSAAARMRGREDRRSVLWPPGRHPGFL